MFIDFDVPLTRISGKGSAHAIPADFYKVEDCKRMVEELKKRESKLHVLVNNSGSNWGAPFDEVSSAYLCYFSLFDFERSTKYRFT